MNGVYVLSKNTAVRNAPWWDKIQKALKSTHSLRCWERKMNKNHQRMMSGDEWCPAILESRGLRRLHGLTEWRFKVKGPSSRDSHRWDAQFEQDFTEGSWMGEERRQTLLKLKKNGAISGG
jgi:hypothetical protein